MSLDTLPLDKYVKRSTPFGWACCMTHSHCTIISRETLQLEDYVRWQTPIGGVCHVIHSKWRSMSSDTLWLDEHFIGHTSNWWNCHMTFSHWISYDTQPLNEYRMSSKTIKSDPVWLMGQSERMSISLIPIGEFTRGSHSDKVNLLHTHYAQKNEKIGNHSAFHLLCLHYLTFG